MKGKKGESQEIHSIKAEIIKKDYIIVSLKLKLKKIKIPSKLFSINNKIKVTFDCIIKVTKILFKSFVKNNFCKIF